MGQLITIIGLGLNTIASIIVIWPYLQKHNIDDDFIVESNRRTGDFKQKKHVMEKRFAMWGFSLFAIGFVLQIIGIALG